MGAMVSNMVAMSAFIGFNMGLDTLISQAAGAGNLELCGVLVHRARVVLSLLFIPIMGILANMKNILISLG